MGFWAEPPGKFPQSLVLSTHSLVPYIISFAFNLTHDVEAFLSFLDFVCFILFPFLFHFLFLLLFLTIFAKWPPTPLSHKMAALTSSAILAIT